MAIKERAETEIILSGGDKAGKTINELTAQSVKLYREIKKMEEGSDEFVKATADYQKINGRLKEVRTQVNGVTKAQGLLNSEFGRFIPFNSQIQKFMGSYKGIASAIKGTTMAQKMLTAAFIASGIGAIVVLLGSLISYLTTTQEGMDMLRKVTMPVIQVFERLKGLLQTFGKGLAQIVSGDVVGGFNSLKDAVLGIGDAFTEGIAAGKELAELTVQIEEETNRLELSKAKLNRQISEEMERSRDLALSEKERQAAAGRAIELINERTKQETALLDLQIRKMELEHEANDTSRSEEFELMKLKAEREEVESTAARERRRLNNIANEDAIKGEKTVTGSVKTEKDNQLKIQQEYNRMVEKADKDLQQLRISLIEDETARKTAQYTQDIESFKGTEDQKAEYTKIKQQQLAKELAAIEQQIRQDKIKTVQEEEEAQRMVIEENFYNFLISESEREDMLYELRRSEAERRLDLIRDVHGAESLEYKKQSMEIAKMDHEVHAARLKEAERYVTAKMQLEQMGMDAFQDVVAGTIALLSTEEDGRRKNIGAIRAFKALQMKLSYFSELQAIWETSNANPSNILFPGSGNIIAGLKTAAATARYGVGIREVMGAKYALGGPVFGPSHASGGIPFGVKGSRAINEMEGNEIILTKGVYQDPILRNAASLINTLGGGRSFAMGGPINPLNKTASPNDSPSTIVNNITNGSGSEENKALLNEMKGFREDINTWQSQLEVRLSLQKFNKEMGRIKEVEYDAGI